MLEKLSIYLLIKNGVGLVSTKLVGKVCTVVKEKKFLELIGPPEEPNQLRKPKNICG